MTGGGGDSMHQPQNAEPGIYHVTGYSGARRNEYSFFDNAPLALACRIVPFISHTSMPPQRAVM